MSTSQEIISSVKTALAKMVQKPMASLAESCAEVWPDANAIDKILQEGMGNLPHCHLMYAWNIEGIEVSSMVQKDNIDTKWRGTDLSQRPYLKKNLPYKGVMLSSVYNSIYSHTQCITVLQAINHDGKLLGFVAADFAANELLRDTKLSPQEHQWQQFRGDPAVRGQLFAQQRVPSLFDEHIEEAMDSISTLMIEHGVFHSKIHFSSGRCSFWLLDDPYNYRIHGVDEMVNPDICLAYPIHPYPDNAAVTPKEIRKTFMEFISLRFADETIYLRSASINIMNGMIGLTFSCDGSHYMPVKEFLDKELSFWIGANATEKEKTRQELLG
ncbi:MAG: PDC sensor domain-containing protein [Gammaproteobacteria bacterium]|nr:PDC sensor domain-containing protein [Gammaproteobacteria bacterium]MDH5614853.1 PDC sensor domain-containing protein [Gammaproteobacteria bacterium]